MIVALLAATHVSSAQESRFVTLQLPLKVTVKVPANWRPLTGDERANIETSSEAALDLAHIAIPRGKRVNLFRANSTPPTTYAAIAITIADADSVDLQVLETATDAEVSQLGSMLEPARFGV